MKNTKKWVEDKEPITPRTQNLSWFSLIQDLLQSPIQTHIELSLTPPLCTTRSTSQWKETSSNPALVYNNPVEVFSHSPENEGQPKTLGQNSPANNGYLEFFLFSQYKLYSNLQYTHNPNSLSKEWSEEQRSH